LTKFEQLFRKRTMKSKGPTLIAEAPWLWNICLYEIWVIYKNLNKCDRDFRFLEVKKFKTSWDLFNHLRWRSAKARVLSLCIREPPVLGTPPNLIKKFTLNLEQARAETGGAEKWVLKRRELPGVCHREWKNTPASLGNPLSVFNKNSTLNPPGGILCVDRKSRTRRKRTPPEEQSPKLILGSLGFLVCKPPNQPPCPWVTPLSVFWGGGFLTMKLSKIIKERFVTKTFQKKTYFFRRSPSRKKERKKEMIFFWNPNTINFSRYLRTIHGSRYRDLRVLRDCVAKWRFTHIKKTQEVKSRSTPKERKIQYLVKDINQTQKNIICANQWGNREIETCDKSGELWRRFCRIGTSFLIFFTLMSIQND